MLIYPVMNTLQLEGAGFQPAWEVQIDGGGDGLERQTVLRPRQFVGPGDAIKQKGTDRERGQTDDARDDHPARQIALRGRGSPLPGLGHFSDAAAHLLLECLTLARLGNSRLPARLL